MLESLILKSCFNNPEGQVLILEFLGNWGYGKRWKDEILTDSKGESSG